MIENKPLIILNEFSLEKATEFVNRLTELENMFSPNQPIVVQIESYGGAVHGLLMIYEAIRSSPNPIITYCSGIAASAGCILLVSAAKKGNRIVSKNAELMWHEFQIGVEGDIKDVNDRIDFMNRQNDKLTTIFAESFGFTMDSWRKYVKENAKGHDFSVTAQEALKLGMVDHIANVRLTPEIGFSVHMITDEIEEVPMKMKKAKK